MKCLGYKVLSAKHIQTIVKLNVLTALLEQVVWGLTILQLHIQFSNFENVITLTV